MVGRQVTLLFFDTRRENLHRTGRESSTRRPVQALNGVPIRRETLTHIQVGESTAGVPEVLCVRPVGVGENDRASENWENPIRGN
jgi:hypothetical protein